MAFRIAFRPRAEGCPGSRTFPVLSISSTMNPAIAYERRVELVDVAGRAPRSSAPDFGARGEGGPPSCRELLVVLPRHEIGPPSSSHGHLAEIGVPVERVEQRVRIFVQHVAQPRGDPGSLIELASRSAWQKVTCSSAPCRSARRRDLHRGGPCRTVVLQPRLEQVEVDRRKLFRTLPSPGHVSGSAFRIARIRACRRRRPGRP